MFRRKPEASAHGTHASVARLRAVSVDIDLSELAAAAQAPEPDRGWLESSQDLQRGARVRETPLHSLPVELIDAFLRRHL
jgi:hypothetical protein